MSVEHVALGVEPDCFIARDAGDIGAVPAEPVLARGHEPRIAEDADLGVGCVPGQVGIELDEVVAHGPPVGDLTARLLVAALEHVDGLHDAVGQQGRPVPAIRRADVIAAGRQRDDRPGPTRRGLTGVAGLHQGPLVADVLGLGALAGVEDRCDSLGRRQSGTGGVVGLAPALVVAPRGQLEAGIEPAVLLVVLPVVLVQTGARAVGVADRHDHR